MVSKLLVLFLFLCGFCHGAEIGIRNYAGYEVLRIHPSNEAQYKALLDLHNGGNFDFWAGPSKVSPTDIMVDPNTKTALETYLKHHNIQFSIFINDVGKIVSEQRESRLERAEMNWNDYQLLDTIYEWIDSLQASYPDLVTVTTIGQSTEGRDIKLLKISTGGSGKKAFWIDGAIHAREWISPATVTYAINELVTKSEKYTSLFDVLDFYILPVVNPDGYVYSHTTDRMWRKTRSDHDSIFGCRGVDANRNFGFHWGENGSSNDKCSETYRGPSAYSEPEADAVKNYINANRDSIDWDTFITVHSYGQLWMTPWGYSDDLTPDYPELKKLGDEAVAKLASHFGTSYKVGNAAGILYYSSGSSRDWAKGHGGFKYVYTIELRDQGSYGFLLPKEQIMDTAVETWDGIQVIAQKYVQK